MGKILTEVSTKRKRCHSCSLGQGGDCFDACLPIGWPPASTRRRLMRMNVLQWASGSWIFSRELRCVSDDINHGVARMDAFKWQAGAR
jgi:hypothetical protein